MSQDRYDNFLKDIGMNIRLIRKSLGMSMEDVAHEAEIEYRQLGRIERGEVNATIVSFLRIAEAMNVDVHKFFIVSKSFK